MSPAPLSLPPKSKELLQKADQAFDLRNYEYAMVLYRSLLEQFPEYHPARFKYHVSAMRNEEINPKSFGGKAAAHVRALKPYLQATWMMRQQNWLLAVAGWEKCLGLLPFSAKIHWNNARCLESLGWNEAAIDEYRFLRNITPGNPAPLRELGRLYSQESRWEDAREAYEALLKIAPHDPAAPAELRKIAAIHTIEKGGWQESATYRDKIRDERQAKFFEQQERLVKTPEEIENMVQTLQAKLIAEPRNAGLWKEIAKLHAMKGDWEKAKETLRNALKAIPSDYFLGQQLQEIEMAQTKAEIERLSAEGKTQELENLTRQYRQAKLRDKQSQVAQYPTNLLLRFELGEMFLEEGLIDEAIAEFQQAVKNPNKRIEAQKYLGECFHRKRLYDLAVVQFKNASEALKEMSGLKKEILYALASVYEAMGKIEEAKREYEKIYTVDIAYRDVARKVEGK